MLKKCSTEHDWNDNSVIKYNQNKVFPEAVLSPLLFIFYFFFIALCRRTTVIHHGYQAQICRSLANTCFLCRKHTSLNFTKKPQPRLKTVNGSKTEIMPTSFDLERFLSSHWGKMHAYLKTNLKLLALLLILLVHSTIKDHTELAVARSRSK